MSMEKAVNVLRCVFCYAIIHGEIKLRYEDKTMKKSFCFNSCLYGLPFDSSVRKAK